MFTGIISSLGTIESVESRGDTRVTIACDFASSLKIGESVACNGVCLTVVEISPPPLRGRIKEGGAEFLLGDKPTSPPPALHSPARGEGYFAVDISAETISRTAPHWKNGVKVNLERSLKMGDALDGHLVTGHIDGTAAIKNIIKNPLPRRGRVGVGADKEPAEINCPPPNLPPNGGGISHILELEASPALARFIAEKGSVALDGVSLTVNKVEGARFWVNIIPHTWQNTTFAERKPGDALNLEIDLIARYIERLLSTKH